MITAARTRWLDKAVAGPVVLGEEAEQSLDQPGSAAALGLSEDEVDQTIHDLLRRQVREKARRKADSWLDGRPCVVLDDSDRTQR